MIPSKERKESKQRISRLFEATATSGALRSFSRCAAYCAIRPPVFPASDLCGAPVHLPKVLFWHQLRRLTLALQHSQSSAYAVTEPSAVAIASLRFGMARLNQHQIHSMDRQLRCNVPLCFENRYDVTSGRSNSSMISVTQYAQSRRFIDGSAS